MTIIANKRRWGDNDRHLGPFTFSFRESYRPIAIVLSSGGEGRGGGCHIRFQAFGATMICELPRIVKPHRRWVDTTRYEWSHNPAGGYWDEYPREYGFTLNEGHLSVPLGAQTMDSSTEQRWGCFLPWTQWRQVAHRIYNADGSLAGEVASLPWDERAAVVDATTRASFLIDDYDGQRITAKTYVEEREWRLGTGLFRWLGFLRAKKRRRSLDIAFSDEVGPEKGSWKGGTIGTGIEMLPGETTEQAFRRFCADEHRAKSRRYRVKFVSPVLEVES